MTEGICFSQAPFGCNSYSPQTGELLHLCLKALPSPCRACICAFYPCLSSGFGITGPASKVTSMCLSSVRAPSVASLHGQGSGLSPAVGCCQELHTGQIATNSSVVQW